MDISRPPKCTGYGRHAINIHDIWLSIQKVANIQVIQINAHKKEKFSINT